mmetsp:Transcript_58807/g.170612  ORF Transcript_58807/g.170612 Transcript_58807/m.170612 type:complete len:334 (-) Transcript_58807:89-1090(-)
MLASAPSPSSLTSALVTTLATEDDEGETSQGLAPPPPPSPEARRASEAAALVELRAALAEDAGQSAVPDSFLEKCLVYQAWQVDKAAAIVRGFVAFRKSVDWPLRISAADVEPALRSGLHWLLYPSAARRPPAPPADGEEGPAACLVFNMARLDTAISSVEGFQRMSTFLMERATDRPDVQRRGIAVLVDFRGVSFAGLLRSVSVDDAQRGVLLWKGAFPCRMRRIWLVQPAPGLHFVIRGILRLLGEKVRRRVRIAESAAAAARIADDLSAFELPAGLGGTAQVPWDAEVSRYLAVERPEWRERCGSDLEPQPARPLMFAQIGQCCASRGYF